MIKNKESNNNQVELCIQKALQAQKAGNLVYAESEYRDLISKNVLVPKVYYQLGQICVQSSRRDEAHSLWMKALSLDPQHLDARMSLASSNQQAGNNKLAISGYLKAIAIHPNFVIAKYLLGNLLKSQGKFEQAAYYYKQIMLQQPDFTQAHFTYSGIHKYTDKNDPHIKTMQDLYQKSSLPLENKIHLAFALAKAFEDIRDFPLAFKYLKTGNKLRYGSFNYHIDSDKELITSIIKTFTADVLPKLQINAALSKRPIFIIGMPRSGTSLVEKIISSHTDVLDAGELDYFFTLSKEYFLNESNDYSFSQLTTYPQSAFEMLGNRYLDKLEELDQQHARITDKLPFNFLMIGLIKIALPNAKIIHCKRGAIDNCLSIYKQNFATGNYRFAYDLKTLGQFHNLYRKLMDHWHGLMPDSIYDVCYESLARNPEEEIAKLLDACDLDWQDNCLNFSDNKSGVTTASFFQVRQPMYTSSIHLWENYRDYLQPLIDELDCE